MEGGIADNVVPEDCRFHYEFRNLPGADVAADAGRGERLRRQPRAGDAGGGPRDRHPLREDLRDAGVPGARRRSRRAARRRLAEAEATTLVAFGTEAGLFQKAGIPTVVCGPGHIAQAHQADEYVSLAQLAAGERFLQALMTVTPEALAGRHGPR